MRSMKPRIYLRSPALSDESAFLRAVRQSKSLHRPWVSPPSSADAFGQYLEAMALPANQGYLVCLHATDELVGVVNITNIVRGCFQSGYLGYYALAGYERQGLMREGLQAVIKQAFGVLKLHRLEANIQPANLASLALVKACGFRKEGFSAHYLKIGGRWRDHERWAVNATVARR